MKKMCMIVISVCMNVLLLAGCGKKEEIARTAYASFLSGDRTVLDGAQEEMWWIPDFQDENMEYECTYLDVDEDGVVELIVQMTDNPNGYNGVFHFDFLDDKLFCWNSDAAEMSYWDYPLRDGTMVRKYVENGMYFYTIFHYKYKGEKKIVTYLLAREELIPGDSLEPCPYYEIDGKEVEKAVFDEKVNTLITEKMLERSEWEEIK